MSSLSTLLLSGIAHASRLLYLLCAMKLIAVTLGVEGVGFYSNYMSLLSIATSLGGGGIITGVIKYVSDITISKERKKIVITNAFVYGGIFSVLILFIGLLFLEKITLAIFQDVTYVKFIISYLIVFFVYGIVNISCSVLNGYKKTLKYSLIISFSHIISFGLLFIYYYLNIVPDTWGVLIILSCPIFIQFLILVFTWSFSLLEKIDWSESKKHLKSDSIKFSKYSLMLITSTVCFPIVEILIRGKILKIGTMSDVGIWQGVTKLSAAGLSFFSLFLSIYLIPRFSGEVDKKKILNSVYRAIGVVTLVYAFVGIVLFCFSDKVLELVYSHDFVLSSQYLVWQFLGDYFRVLGWIVGFYIVSNALTFPYIAGELLQGGGFLLSSTIFLLYNPSTESVFYAYLATSLVYVVILYTIFYLKIFKGFKL